MEPITREEMYLAAAAGYDVTPPEPVTRKEFFLEKMAGMDVQNLAVFSREEMFLNEVAQRSPSAVIEALNVTENGTYEAPEGVAGYNPVTVNVASSGGGGSLPAGAYWEALTIPYQNVYRQKWVEFNGALYAFINGTAGNSGFRYIYKYQNNAWSKIYDAGSLLSIGNADSLEPVEYNGKLHLYGGGTNKHYTFDGVSFVTKNALLGTIGTGYRAMFVQDGKLKAHCSSTKTVYTWDEASDVWSAESNVNDDNGHHFVINGIVYVFDGTNVLTYKDGVRTQIATLPSWPSGCGVENNEKVYYIVGNSTVSAQKLYEFDPETKAVREVGAIPSMGSSKVLSVCDHRIAFMSYECSFASTIVLHEVTE